MISRGSGLHILRKSIHPQRSPFRQLWLSCRQCAKQKPDTGPIPFLNSKAASWSMTKAVIHPARDVPWYQPISVTLSLGAFLLYFLALREENDLDVELNYSLFERVPQLEEHQVKVAIDYNRRQGRDTLELENRLKEIQLEKQEKKKNASN